mgnify:CR=1 FL=1
MSVERYGTFSTPLVQTKHQGDENQKVNKMPFIIMCHGFADGSDCPMEGQFVETFDHDAYNGQGHGVFTDDISKAMCFKTVIEAMEFWNRISTVRPLRADGKPNRPLTATTVSIERIDDNG